MADNFRNNFLVDSDGQLCHSLSSIVWLWSFTSFSHLTAQLGTGGELDWGPKLVEQ